MIRLTVEEINSKLSSLNADVTSEWQIKERSLFKMFTFENFKVAMVFMNQVADEAEKIDHHPDWCNRYNKVEIRLTTHASRGLTQLDFELADRMESIFKSRNFSANAGSIDL